MLCERREALNLSLCALAQLARVNRGSLSQIMNGKRPCGRTDRAALMQAVGLGIDLQEQFLKPSLCRAPISELLLLDPPTCPHPPLEKGQRFLIRGLYLDARREFEAVFKSAAVEHDDALQADAAARLGWLYFELDQAGEALRWLALSIGVIENYFRVQLGEIIGSFRPGSHSALCDADDPVSHVLSRALHIRCKVLAGRMVYHNEWERRTEADTCLAKSGIGSIPQNTGAVGP